jgi:hypothetical protein
MTDPFPDLSRRMRRSLAMRTALASAAALLGLAVLVLICFPLWYLARESMDLLRLDARAEATIEQVEYLGMPVQRSRRSSTDRQWRVTYRFTANGRAFSSSRVSCSELLGPNALTGSRDTPPFTVGEVRTVHFRNVDPGQCCLDYGWHARLVQWLLMLTLPALFLGLGEAPRLARIAPWCSGLAYGFLAAGAATLFTAPFLIDFAHFGAWLAELAEIVAPVCVAFVLLHPHWQRWKARNQAKRDGRPAPS